MQHASVRDIIAHKQFYAHHGDCIGADAEFHALACLAPYCYGIILHPSTHHDRAFVQLRYPRDCARDTIPPLERNKQIVDESTSMIATPQTAMMTQRSGTWSTIRYARSAGKPIAIVYPNGGISYEGAWP